MEKSKKYLEWIFRNKALVLIVIIFLFEFFLRFYQMDVKNPFGYDQVDNAWAAKNLIVNHKIPLIGMVAKANSGIYIGPLYYYFISIFYWVFNLNPVASWYIAGLTSLFSFFVIFFITKKLFNKEVAIIAIFINTFSFSAIFNFDRIQWPVQFLPIISLIIFFLLYKITLGEVKKIIPLAIAIGIAFSIHFTAIFFPIIVILVLPFFPRSKKTIKYILISVPLFLVWLLPNIAYMMLNKSANSTVSSYISTYYHGFHVTRMFQIVGDAFIQFDYYLLYDKIKFLKFLAFPLFFFFYLKKSFKSEKLNLAYLVFLWFAVPWLVFTTYAGEISDYYFSITRYIALFIIAYFLYRVWKLKYFIGKILVVILLGFYSINNLINFFSYQDGGNLIKKENNVKQVVKQGRRIEFQVGAPESYLYYYYMRQKGVEVYVSKTK